MIDIGKGKTLEVNWINEEGGGQSRIRFSNGLGTSGIGGYAIPQYLQYKNSDISLITRKSSRLVSQYDLLTYSIRILLRVISKGRDKVVEIDSN